MASDPHWDTAIQCSHAPGVGAGESRASAATRCVEGAPAAAAADGDGPHLLDPAVQDLEELERLLFASAEVGSRERFEKVFGHQQSLGAFIRSLVGLDREAATEAFGEFLHNTTYSATQIRFIDQVISYLTQNGTMDPGLLYEPPFTDIHDEGLDGVFGDDGATRIINLLEKIRSHAAA